MSLLERLTQIFAAPPAGPAATELYRRAVLQARSEEFYRLLGVPDTIDGRFDLLLLHVFLIMRRLGEEAALKQNLFDLMFADMDQSLREMGVGDMSIGKRMKPMIAAFYGRAQAYEKALAGNGNELAAALARNLYGKIAPSPAALRQLADYVRRSAAGLENQPLEDLLSGQAVFAGFITI